MNLYKYNCFSCRVLFFFFQKIFICGRFFLLFFFQLEIILLSFVLYLRKKGISPKDIHIDIVHTLGHNTIGPSTVSKILRLEKCSQSNKPIQKKRKISKNQIIVKHALKLYPFSSVRDIA